MCWLLITKIYVRSIQSVIRMKNQNNSLKYIQIVLVEKSENLLFIISRLIHYLRGRLPNTLK